MWPVCPSVCLSPSLLSDLWYRRVLIRRCLSARLSLPSLSPVPSHGKIIGRFPCAWKGVEPGGICPRPSLFYYHRLMIKTIRYYLMVNWGSIVFPSVDLRVFFSSRFENVFRHCLNRPYVLINTTCLFRA